MDHESKDHHYVPAFYLRGWECPSSGKLLEFRRIHNDKVAKKPVSAKATGFQRHLYSVERAENGELDHSFEGSFMKHLDDDASKVLEKIRNNDFSLSTEERHRWARFVVSLLVRSPEGINGSKETFDHLWVRPGEEHEKWYAEVREEGFPETFREILAQVPKHEKEQERLKSLAHFMDAGEVVNFFVGLKWSFRDVEKANRRLVTSDRPVVTNNRLGHADGFLFLPISPTKVFLVRPRKSSPFASVESETVSNVAKFCNKSVVAQAKQFVWSESDSQEAFIKKWIGSMPAKSFVEIAREAILKLGRVM